MNITSFRENIKRRLGEPVYKVEITTEQIDIQISDALDLLYHWDQDMYERGVEVIDVVSGTNEYTLDSDVMKVISYINTSSISGFPSYKKIYWEGILNSAGASMSSNTSYYAIANAYLKDLDMMLGVKREFVFNRLTHKINFLTEISENEKMGLYVIKNLSGNLESLYEDSFFQRLATALCKKQWGSNLGKYDKNLIGGAKINYERIITEAEAEILKLKEELVNDRFTAPAFFIG